MKKVWHYLGYLYYPVFITFVALHIIARFVLAITYFGMLEARKGKDVLKHIW